MEKVITVKDKQFEIFIRFVLLVELKVQRYDFFWGFRAVCDFLVGQTHEIKFARILL